jgi:DNA-binding PadR family transcriptional regulator
VSPVFRHGRLRLYLLKLLDEAPRHGYEVIRLLQDRFLGVYAPSPGTIYPRLARLEEDGLVTHEEVGGKKIYSITDKGREEIRTRLGELADLEDELTESLRDVAREISEDVRDTVRSIREDFASAAREFRNQGASEQGPSARSGDAPDDDTPGSDESRRIRAAARQNREEMRAAFRARGRNRGDRAGWQDKIGGSDWAGWKSWSDWAGGGETPASSSGKSATGSSASDNSAPWPGGPGRRPRGPAAPFGDLERMALQFATELLRTAAKQAGDIGERSMNDLRDILTDTLDKVRGEVFTQGEPEATSAPASTAGTADASETAGTKVADSADQAESAGSAGEPGGKADGEDRRQRPTAKTDRED